MANFETRKEFLRIDPNFRKSLVQEVLPEYFQTSYPNLIAFLDGYYEWLDSDENVGGAIAELHTVRDLQDSTLKRLDFVFDELALGISESQFLFPREALRNFGNFFRVKGSLYSADGFFRAFFNEDIEVTYPKESILKIGVDPIGPEQAFVLTDGRLYQILSILIKSPISLNTWEQLYRKFVHPTGFYLGAQTVIEGQGSVIISTTTSDPDPDPTLKIIGSASFTIVAENDTTILIPDDGGDSDGCPQRMNPLRTIDFYDGATNTMQYFTTWYSNLDEWGGFPRDGLTFDDYADSAGASAMRFDNTYETMDHRIYETFCVPYVDNGHIADNSQLTIGQYVVEGL